MKSYKFLITLLILLTSAISADAAPKMSDWAADSIYAANLAGIITQEHYSSDYTVPITRNEIARLIANAYENITGEEYKSSGSPFIDASGSHVAAVYELGIMNGRGENVFSPDDYTTRQEMAKIILTFKAVAENTTLNLPKHYESNFTDFDYISDWAKPYVVKAVSENIINGYDDSTFAPAGTVSREQAIALITRAVSLNKYEQPVITGIENDCIIPSSADFDIFISGDKNCKIYAEKISGYPYTKTLGSGNNLKIKAGQLESDSLYCIYAESHGVFSEPVRVYTDKYNLFVSVPSYTSAGPVKIQWLRIPGVGLYTINVTENRLSYYEGDIPPKDTLTYEIQYEDFFNINVNPNRKYTIEIIAGDCRYIGDIYVESVNNDDASEIAANYPTTKEAAEALMTTVKVPVWKLKDNKKVSSTISLTVHNKIAEKVKLVFEEIYNGPEKFPIKDAGAFNWRGKRSEHNGGTAIDINYNENYCVYSNGSITGKYWKPYEDPHSITPYGDVVRAFEKYGFTWGGDAWSNPKDYMHFSYLGT